MLSIGQKLCKVPIFTIFFSTPKKYPHPAAIEVYKTKLKNFVEMNKAAIGFAKQALRGTFILRSAQI